MKDLLKKILSFFREENKEEPSLVVRREVPVPHYELHYDKRVEFRDLSGNRVHSDSKVEVYNYY